MNNINITSSKSIGTVSVDMDGLWVILRYLGYKCELYPDHIFDSTLPIFFDLFDKYEIQATFFVNVLDLRIPQKKALILEIIRRGHEVGNHGLTHSYLNGLTASEKKKEIIESTQILEEAIGEKILGFRAPGYDIDAATLDILEELDYLYDASVFPTSITLLLLISQKILARKKKSNFGGFKSCLASLEPYRPNRGKIQNKGNRNIIEIPISTVPLLRIPFHFSYALLAGMGLFKLGINLIKFRKLTVNYLFHLLDLVDIKSDKRFQPIIGAKQSAGKRLSMAEDVIRTLKENFQLMPIKNACEIFISLEQDNQ